MMRNKTIVGCISLLLYSPFSMAMQPLDDQVLSNTTGQDGINIGFGVSKVEVKQASIIDNDGISTSTDYKSRASLVLAGQTNTPVSISLVGANSNPSISAIIDTDGNGGKPFANIGVSIAQNITGIKISPFSIYVASAASTSDALNNKSIYATTGTLNADVKKILNIGSASNNFEIAFHNTNKPGLNVQLGNVPQSHMLAFSGSIQSICGTGSGCPISIVSDATAASFDFQLKASDTTSGFRLNQFHAGVEKGGIVFGNYGATATDKITSDKVDVSLNNVLLGTSGVSDTTVFNGIKNGSMGNIGAVGASVTNLKVRIAGL